MVRGAIVFVAGCVVGCGAMAAADPGVPIDGTTARGDRIRLYPNGRWEYVEATKSAAQQPVIDAYDKEKAREQGGIFGFGRKIQPGDSDYNRGSLGGKSK